MLRHGTTDAIVQKIVQSVDEPLNQQGLKEAGVLAERTTALSFAHLVSSPTVRAFQTAQVISKTVAQELIVSELFAERKRPSIFAGCAKNDEKYVAYRALEKEHFLESDWKLDDSESFTELQQRTKDALAYLLSLEGDVCVVSHEYICKFITTYILMGETVTPTVWQSTYRTMKMNNCAITVFKYQAGAWSLITWNDHAHFAE